MASAGGKPSTFRGDFGTGVEYDHNYDGDIDENEASDAEGYADGGTIGAKRGRRR